MSTQRYIVGNSSLADLIRDFDWTGHPLGPVGIWPETLIDVVNIMLSSPLPMQVYWGPEMWTIYNDPLLRFIEERHPAALGLPVREVWPDAWPLIKDQLNTVFTTGESISFVAMPLRLLQNGQMEDMFWTYAYSPVYGRDGEVDGILNIAQNVTAQRHAEDSLRAAKDSATLPYALISRG